MAITIKDLMEQAQVFASAWSLVGGVFDKGDQLRVAEDEKARLEDMLEEFQEEIDLHAAPGNLKEIAEGLIQWHGSKIKQIQTVLSSAPDTPVSINGADLTGEKLSGFRIGMIIALDLFEKFPLSIDGTAPTSDEEE